MTAESEHGFSLIEWLLAAFVTLVVTGAALALVGPAQNVFRAQPEAADVHQRLRVAVDALKRDVIMAGAGSYAGRAVGPLNHFFAPILPYRAFGAGSDPELGVYFTADAISFLYVPATPAQTVLADSLAPGALDVQLTVLPSCPPTTEWQVCGFGPGTRLIVFDSSGRWDVFNVDGTTGGSVQLQHRGPPVVARYDAGSFASEVRFGTYYYRRDTRADTSLPAVAESAQVGQLVRFDGWATHLPVVDEVVGLEFAYFGDAGPPLLTGRPLEEATGPWTTYGPAPPPLGITRGPWPPGENCTFTVVEGAHVPRLSALGPGGTSRLALTASMLTDGPWCPDVLSPSRFDADLLRVRRVRVALRVQSALAALRGPAGVLFRRGGTARGGDRYVPDLAVQFDVAPRNLSLGQ